LASSISTPPERPPAILDIEASGFGLGSYPIEVGYVLPDGSLWCSLIQPESDWQHWDPNAEAVHHISREQLQQHGRGARDVAEQLNAQLRGMTVYSDAWAHDYTWLNRLYEVAQKSPSFKLDNLRTLLSDEDAARWHEVKRSVALAMSAPRHRASADARLLQQTLMTLHHPRYQQVAA
jgi:hypothetical protein